MSLNKHVRETHTVKSRESCNVCMKEFASKLTRDQHLKYVHGEKNYFCDFCDKPFATKTYLKKHIRGIHDQRMIECDVCGKKFNSKNFNKHRAIHKNVCKCPVCSENLKTKEALKEHLLSHSHPQPYKCELCEERYFTSSYLHNHYEQVHSLSYTLNRIERAHKREQSRQLLKARL